ncbi:MAG: discoidin domain-containing protein [Sedimentisphaerales bacterium]|nr:discoidin domain-containing protein [Sedimentisphaerales bacterium]
MCERHANERSTFLVAIIFVVLGATVSALGVDHFWTGAVSRDAADPRNWDNGSATPTLPSGSDIVRIGCTSAWADYVPANQPVLSSEWNGRSGGPKAGWWFVLGVGNQNTLTIDDGAYIEFSHNDCNLRNGGILHVMGRSADGGPSLVIPPRFRIANNGDSITTATGTLRIDDDGYVRFDPTVATGGSGGYQIYMGALANALIEIRDDGILELVQGYHRGGADLVTPRFDFATADPAVNKIVISGNGQLLLAGDPPTANVAGTETSILDLIDAGLITTDEPGGALTVTGSNPTVIKLGERRIATDPSPADGLTDVVRQVTLAWQPGVDVQAHDVYLATVFDDVNDASRTNPLGVLVSEGQPGSTYEPENPLEFAGTYYWRIDEVAADGTITRGAVWTFSVEPLAYPIAGNLIVATASSSAAGFGPEKTIDGSGLTGDEHSDAAVDMWQSEAGAEEPVWIQYAFDQPYKLHELKVWNFNANLEYLVGFGLKEVTVQYSLDGADWSALGKVTFAQGTSVAGYAANTTVDVEGVVAQYVRLVVNSSYGAAGQHGLSEVRFLYIPTYPRQPEPAAGATAVDTEVVLSWRAGRDASSHDVYLSADEQAVVTGQALVDSVSQNRYELSGLDLDATYFWRIEEREGENLWAGELWRFTTQDSYVVDDFESYTDDEEAGEVIWQTWIDGYGVDNNGAQVGNDLPPYAERAIVYQGRQSMPLSYDNTGGATFSEATRTFDTAQDWTRGGAQVLVLYFYGQSDNTAGQLYVKIDGTKIVYSGAASDLAEPAWMQWAIDLDGLNVTSVTELGIGVDGASASGQLYVDEVRLYRAAPPFEE